MLKTGQMIENPVTGVRMRVCESGMENGGTRAVVEFLFRPHSGKEATAHWHACAAETFEILAGSAHYELGGVEHSAVMGDVLDFPPRLAHLHPWNIGDTELHVRQTINLPEPDQQNLTVHGVFFETLFALACDGKVGADGRPAFLQLAVMARSLQPHTYLAGMPAPVQTLFFGTLALVGGRLGYRTAYP